MNYQEIEDLLFSEETNDHLLDGDLYSDPFFAKVGDQTGDMFLLYTMENETSYVYGMLVISPSSRGLIYHTEVAEVLLSDFRLSDEVAEAYRQTYVKVHAFAFEPQLTQAQTEDLRAHWSLLKKDVCAPLIAVYETFMPDFLLWAEKQLAGGVC